MYKNILTKNIGNEGISPPLEKILDTPLVWRIWEYIYLCRRHSYWVLNVASAKRSLIGACVAFSWPDALPDVKPMVQSSSFPISLISSSLPHFPLGFWHRICVILRQKILFPSGVLYIYCLFFVTSPFVYILGSLLIQFLLIPMDLYWLLTHFPCRFRSEPGSRNMKRSLIRCRFFYPIVYYININILACLKNSH